MRSAEARQTRETMPRIWKEEWKTYKDVFDQFSERNLYKLILNKTIDGLDSPLSIGKEANLFTARKGEEVVVVKMYRLSTCDFNRMYEYLSADPRSLGVKRSHRQIIFAWAKREFRNLLLAREAGVSVPTPFVILFNILVMECVFSKNIVAQKLHEDTPKYPQLFFEELMSEMKKMHNAGLVHGDLSPFNILNADQHPVLIDWSQATTLENQNARDFLKRDVKNVCTYFRKLGVKCEEEKVLNEIISSHL